MDGDGCMILSLDQSLTNTGYIVADCGHVLAHGIIKTEAQKKKRNIGDMNDKCRRTIDIIDAINKLVNEYRVKAMICEEYAGFSQSKSSSDALATSRTIVVAISRLLNVPLQYIPAMDAKKALTNNKNASKVEMIEAAANVYPDVFKSYRSERSKSGWEGKTEHLADAVGIYLAGRKLTNIQFIEKFPKD